jgi:hypothetical protein
LPHPCQRKNDDLLESYSQFENTHEKGGETFARDGLKLPG